jgi:beta-phosphoglucomutase family hydrolase
MAPPRPKRPTAGPIAAAVFDLDGVITRTERVHAAAWKQAFDAFLLDRATQTGEAFVPFDPVADYLAHVDGKPRRDGVVDFLHSRGIDTSDDAIDAIAREKNELFRALVDQMGVDVFPSSLVFVRALRRAGVPTAVASSSRNCARILEAAGIGALFGIRVDGNDLALLGLPGKPAPDLFLEAARRLQVRPARAAVFEDAAAGVEAGRRAGYGLVVGLARSGNEAALRDAGADIVVDDLADLDPHRLIAGTSERPEAP